MKQFFIGQVVWTTSCDLLWLCRDDLRIPSSPYIPAYAQAGQGPPPMMQERFQSVISQLFQHVGGSLQVVMVAKFYKIF